MSRYVPAELEAVDHPEKAAAGADLIVCATGSNVPVLFGEWLSPGVHVTSIVGSNKELLAEGLVSRPRREIDDEVVRRSDVIVATLLEQAKQDEQGDFVEPISKGILRWEDVRELGPLVAGKVPGRAAAAEITLFKQNSDQGVGFMALARLAYDKAKANGVGIEV
jgi:ornithine cyclodeaminase/alanine dehydrogenase-like protein (mu-crystallin family)